MKSQFLKSRIAFGLLCSFSTVVPATLPAIAQTAPVMQSYSSSASITIPQSTAIAVAFPANLVIDAKKEQDYPTTLILAQPLLDSYGNQLAAPGSPVAARIHPVKEGAQVIAESLVIQGRTIPIQATSPVLPSRKVTLSSGNQQARELSPIGSRIGGGLFGGGAGGDFMNFNQGAMLGSGVGAIAGLASEKSMHVVEIPQGSLYVLTLQMPVTVSLLNQPPAVAQSGAQSGAIANPQFRFQTEQEYQGGLDKVLQAYQQRQLSQTDALNVIRAANTYATTQLPRPLYPPAPQRQFIGQVFGFSYAIDSNAPQVGNVSSGPQVLF
jgi:hypothetical protein